MSIWWDKSITLVEGCTPVSAGCDHCWSAAMTNRFHANKGYTDGPHFNGKILFREDRLQEILKRKKPTRWTIWNDLFHPDVTFDQIDKVFAIAGLCPQHELLFLTKRSRQMREYVLPRNGDNPENEGIIDIVCEMQNRNDLPLEAMLPLPNVHFGVTVENQDNVWRIADLIQTPAAKRFVSFEPLLERIQCFWGKPGFDYAFIGCESNVPAKRKPGHRPLCTLDDIRHLMQQCRKAGVKVHVKQIPLNGRCNKHIEQWPPEFQIREV